MNHNTKPEIQVLYEDGELIVCVKPAGILSQADQSESMVSLLAERCDCAIYPLHRLDREVSGVMVYAKTKGAAAFLSREIAERRMIKEYLACVHGCPAEASGEMCDLLFKDSQRNKSFVVDRLRKGVKDAKLEYRVLATQTAAGEVRSLVRIRLHTGRTHQIRVQFAFRKMPLVGDRKYGAKDGSEDLCLWSHKLSFTHPKTKKTVSFCYEPPFLGENNDRGEPK